MKALKLKIEILQPLEHFIFFLLKQQPSNTIDKGINTAQGHLMVSLNDS